MKLVRSYLYDFLLQYRNGFYFAYLFVGLMYAILLQFLPLSIRKHTAIFLIYSDTSVLGFFFIGAMVLLEKAENTLAALFITPFSPVSYIIQKTCTLTANATIISLAIVFIGFGNRFVIPIFILAVIMSSIVFTLFGLAVAAKAKTVNEYFFKSFVYSMIFSLPIIGYFGLTPSWLFVLFPTDAILVLLKATFFDVDTIRIYIAFCILALWILGFYVWANRWFNKYIVKKDS